jgi:hypothetical protein
LLGREEVSFVFDGMALEMRKTFVHRLKWLGMQEVGFGLTEMAWNGESRVWLDWNGLEWRKLVLA